MIPSCLLFFLWTDVFGISGAFGFGVFQQLRIQ
jgi:hypothetical protein